MSLFTSLMKPGILLQYITWFPNLEVQYSKILSRGIGFISLNQRIHLDVYVTGNKCNQGFHVIPKIWELRVIPKWLRDYT